MCIRKATFWWVKIIICINNEQQLSFKLLMTFAVIFLGGFLLTYSIYYIAQYMFTFQIFKLNILKFKNINVNQLTYE